MTAELMSPVPGLRVTRLLDQDPVAVSLLAVVDAGPATGRPVVLTVGHGAAPLSPAGHAMFTDWAQRLGRVSAHPHVADVLTSGVTTDSRPYLVTGTANLTLADALRFHGARSGDDVQAIGVALADALAAAHDVGLVHGAVRPATVLVTGTGPLLAGFDAAAPHLAHPLAPTAYTAPEHLAAAAAGKIAVSMPADVYALAATLYTAVGGRLPWASDDGSGVTDPASRDLPLPDVPGVAPEFLDVLRQALATSPQRRPTAAQFRDAIDGVPGSAMPDGGRVIRTGAPIALALLGGLGARPVADVVANAPGGGAVAGIGTAAAAGTGTGTMGHTATAGVGVGPSRAVGAPVANVGGSGTTAGIGSTTSPSVGTVSVGPTSGGPVSAGATGGAAANAGAVSAGAGMGIGAKIALVVALVVAVAGGGAVATYYAIGPGRGEPAIITTPPLFQGIRALDFRNITFHDDNTARDVTLRDGELRADTDDGPARWSLQQGPVYTDADADGDEDAAVLITYELGNGIFTNAYVFMWEDGQATQIRRPFARGGRCGDMVDRITSDREGFAVALRVRSPDSTSCADPAYVDAPFVAAVRDGFVVRVAPDFGAPEPCQNDVDTKEYRPGALTPRAAPDPKAPAIGENRRFAKVETHTERWRAESADGVWYLATLTETDGTKICGWVSDKELRSR